MEEVIAILGSVAVEITAGIIVLGLTTLLGLVRKRTMRKRYDYIIGEWKGYYMGRKDILIEQRIKISSTLFHLRMSVAENTEAQYAYEGRLVQKEGILYGSLEGINQEDKLFITLLLPFNKRGEVPSLNGIISGIDQHKRPSSVKVHLARLTKTRTEVLMEVGRENRFISVEHDTSENSRRLDVHPDTKQLPGQEND